MSNNQSLQPISREITIASADLHDCACWQTIHSLTSDYLSLLTTFSKHNKTKANHFHFTKSNSLKYQKADLHHLNNMLRIASVIDPQHKCSGGKQTPTIIPKGNHNHTNLTHLPMHIHNFIHHHNHSCKTQIRPTNHYF